MNTRELSDARAQPDAAPSHGTSVELALWRIDGATQRSLRQLGPHVNADLDGILTDFYGFLKRFPETAELIAAEGMVARLICAQQDHWQSCSSTASTPGTWSGCSGSGRPTTGSG